MNRTPPPAGTRAVMNRRDLLRTGGLTLSLGAIVAACGDNRGGPTSPGRLGVAPPAATLPDAVVDDLVLLRTVQSLEHTAVAVHEALLGTGELADDEALVTRLIENHQRHAATIGEIVTRAGGEPFECANPFLMERAVEPALAAIDDGNARRDALNIAHAFEAWIGASCQALVSVFGEPALRSATMQVGAESQRHAAVLARIINPDQTFGPGFRGDDDLPDDEGFPIPYAIPSTFGRVVGIDLVVGERDAEGQRFSVQLQTPAANTFVYDDTSC